MLGPTHTAAMPGTGTSMEALPTKLRMRTPTYPTVLRSGRWFLSRNTVGMNATTTPTEKAFMAFSLCWRLFR